MKDYTPRENALAAARWVVDMDNQPELRQQLTNGHRTRRVQRYENSYTITDHTEADAWLVKQWKQHTDQ